MKRLALHLTVRYTLVLIVASAVQPWELDSSISPENRQVIERMLLEEQYPSFKQEMSILYDTLPIIKTLRAEFMTSYSFGKHFSENQL